MSCYLMDSLNKFFSICLIVLKTSSVSAFKLFIYSIHFGDLNLTSVYRTKGLLFSLVQSLARTIGTVRDQGVAITWT